MRMRARILVFSLVLAAGLACDAVQGEKQDFRTFGEPTLAVQLNDPAINESSGIARSNAFPGWYYTHNDSGDSARFWKFDLTGKVEGPFTIPGAKAIDWEDMSSATVEGKNYLYFGDIGDNALKRKSVQVYRVEEPTGKAGPIAKCDTFELEYPDGPHNAEALLVESSERITIVAKTARTPAKIFCIESPKSEGSNTLKVVGTISVGGTLEPTKLITGGDVSADGKHLVLRTYLAAYEFSIANPLGWWKATPKTIKTANEAQGEAIAYSLDGKELLTTSEYAPCLVSRITLK